MRLYEVIFIVKPMEEDATNAVIEKFTKLIQANGGKIEKEDRWGKKRLAYEIKDMTEGYYVLLYVNAEPACVAECDRVMKITAQTASRSKGRTESSVRSVCVTGFIQERETHEQSHTDRSPCARP